MTFTFTPEELKGSVPDGAVLLGAKKTKIEGDPAGLVEYEQVMERAGQEVRMRTVCLLFVQKRTLVVVSFMVGGLADDKAGVQERAAAFRPLFNQVMNSIVFDERWK
ncbi:MAG: hypothetical protein ABIP14_02825 [Blastocatellia bacterium]